MSNPHKTQDPSWNWTRIVIMNRKVLLGLGVIAGVAQAAAGVAMYLMGVYFAPWSIRLIPFSTNFVVPQTARRDVYLNMRCPGLAVRTMVRRPNRDDMIRLL